MALCLATALAALGHVQVFYNASQMRSVRNAPGPDGTGRMSVNGACGGGAMWGQNGHQVITAGEIMWVKIQYNGGHRSPRNRFQASYLCNADGPTNAEMTAISDDMTMMMPLLPQTTPTRMPGTAATNGTSFFVAAPNGNQVRSGYTLVFMLPLTARGKCTVSLMDQRAWGGCVDLMVQTAPPTSPRIPGAPPPPSRSPTMAPLPIQIDEIDNHPFKNTPTSCGSDFPTCCCVYANFTVRAAGSFGGTTWPDYVDVDMWTDTTCMWPNQSVPRNSTMFGQTAFQMAPARVTRRMVPLTRESSASFVTEQIMFPEPGSAQSQAIMGSEPFRIRVANGTVEYSNEVDSVMPDLGIAFCSGYTSTYTNQVPMLEWSFNDLVVEIQALDTLLKMFMNASRIEQLKMAESVTARAASAQMRFDNFSAIYESLSPYEKRFIDSANVTNATMMLNATVSQSMMAISAATGTDDSKTEGDANASTVGIVVGFFILFGMAVALFAFRGKIAEKVGADNAPSSSSRKGAKELVNITTESSTDDFRENEAFAPSEQGALPAGWETLHDDDGTPYYHNTATGETSWEAPAPVSSRGPPNRAAPRLQ